MSQTARWALFLVNPFDSSCFTASESDSNFFAVPRRMFADPLRRGWLRERIRATTIGGEHKSRTRGSEPLSAVRPGTWNAVKRLFAFAISASAPVACRRFRRQVEPCGDFSPSPRQPHDFGALLAGHDRLQPLIPDLQRMRFPLKHVGVHVMADECPGVFAARLMTDDRGNQIQRDPISASMVANVRRRSWLLNLATGSLFARANRKRPTCDEVSTVPFSSTNSGPFSTTNSRCSSISRARPTIGVTR